MKEYAEFNFEIESKSITEQGVFSGYGSTFGGKPDSYGDIIHEGAFTNTLKKGGRNGYGIAMLWQHNASEPIGVWQDVVENKKGLAVTGQLVLGTQRGREAYELMKAGALRGLSIGFEIPKGGSEFDDNKKIRNIKEIDLWEISPVTFAANTRAQISQVKSLESANTPRQFESALREAGLSKSAAMYLTNLCKDRLSESPEFELLKVLKNFGK